MRVNENPLRDLLRLFLWYPVRWIVLVLPVRAAIALLCFMGDIHFIFSRGKKRALRNNLSLIMPSVPLDDAAVREYFRKRSAFRFKRLIHACGYKLLFP